MEGNSNTIIPANGTVSFGFCGAFEEMVHIDDIVLSEMIITNEESAFDEEDVFGEEVIANEFLPLLKWDEMQDTDGDGLPDEYKFDIGSDYENPDTDGDGLTDGFEEMYACTKPLDKYTLGNGVLDAELDPDEDGLSMLAEYAAGSNPLEDDTDRDNLLDGEEVNDVEVEWDGIDERYMDLGAFHMDTVETLFPEITDKDYNDSSYPSYITVSGNDVVVHLKVVFEGDKDVKASSVLKTTGLTTDQQNEVNNITARLGSDPTLKELAIDGVQSRWANSFVGNEYDFCKGLAVNFSVDVVESTSKFLANDITIKYVSGVCGVSNQSGVNWRTNCNRVITMYTSYCRSDNHYHKDGQACSDYMNSQYHIAQFAGTCAHEFGHTMGVKDLYASATVNHGYTIISNSKVYYTSGYFALPLAGCIMRDNGRGTENDIEMVLLAFCENKWQYYVPWKNLQKMSKAIKSPVEFSKEGDANTYIWDEASHSFIIKI